jgi:hypothetical protein
MPLYSLVIIAVLMGLAAAGLTWFGWDLAQNLHASMQVSVRKRIEKARAAAQKKKAALEEEVRQGMNKG